MESNRPGRSWGAEEALRESEARLAGIVDSAMDAIITVDEEQRVLLFNRAAERMFLYPAEDAVGQPLDRFIPERFRHAHRGHIREFGRTHVTKRAMGAFGAIFGLRADGEEFPVEASISQIESDGRKFYTVILRDITERKRAEEALKESEDRYRDLVEYSHDLICTHDLEGRILSLNRTAAEALGYDRETLLGRNIREALLPEYRGRFDDYIAEVRQEGIARGLMTVRTRAGERRVWEYTNTLRTEGVAAPIVRGVAHDVTERLRAEEALRESEERYRLLFESNPQPMWVYDLETLSFLAVNDAAVRHYGYAREEFLAMTIRDIRPPEDLPALMQTLAEPVAGLDKAVVCRHRKKDGSLIDTEVTSHRLTFAGRRAELVLAQDITERRRLEERLLQSQKMEAVGQLAGGVAHDFNNLLTAINGYSDLTLRRLSAGDPLRRNVEEVRKAGERAASLTRQLLAFSRKQVLQPVALGLNALVSDMEKMLRRLIGEDVELRTALAPDLGRVKADPGQVEQVVMNLCVNARDAMPRGGKLTVETENVALDEEYASRHVGVTPGPYVMLSVSDTGTGMDEETRERIFEPFFTTKEQGKGTGLGLSTVYGIVKQSGGYIEVSSEVGRGTTFRVYFPRAGEGAQEYRRGAEPEEVLRGAETILLTEDEEMVRRLAREVLEIYGYRVLEAANGGAAFLICERHEGPIHLLVTDVVMPEMSGPELAERLARLRPDMRVLYMSGYTDTAILTQGVLEEGADFIHKPFTPGDLARKVREVLDRS